MSEQMKELLASVTREATAGLPGVHLANYGYVLEALERRLLPLLEAGQAMRDEYLKLAPTATILNWDRAVMAAKERQP
jgi:hypothetical protein